VPASRTWQRSDARVQRLKTIESRLRDMGIVRFDVDMHCCEASDFPMFPPGNASFAERTDPTGDIRARVTRQRIAHTH